MVNWKNTKFFCGSIFLCLTETGNVGQVHSGVPEGYSDWFVFLNLVTLNIQMK